MYVIFSNHLNNEHFCVAEVYAQSIEQGILPPKIIVKYDFNRPREDLESILDCIHFDVYDDNNHYLGRFKDVSCFVTNEYDGYIEFMWEHFDIHDGYYDMDHYKSIGWSYVNSHSTKDDLFISDKRKNYLKNLIDSFVE